MESIQSVPADTTRTTTPTVRNHPRFFYSGAAVVLFLFMLWGFQLFFIHGRAYPGRPLTPPIKTLLIAHGIAMALWMILFIAQPLLVATRNYKTHMKLGIFGTGLAAVVTYLGINVAIGAARVNPPELKLWGLAPKQFMAVSLSAILLFAVFVLIGILNRKNADVHRPMMLLASLSVLPPSLDRITVIHNLFEGSLPGNLFGAYTSSLVFGLAVICLHWAWTRKLNRWLAIGYAAITVVAFATMQLAPTPIWDVIASLLVP